MADRNGRRRPRTQPPPACTAGLRSAAPASPSNRYGRLATAVYELDKPVGHAFGPLKDLDPSACDIAYYTRRLKERTSGPVMEAGVGNGRVLIPLLSAGLTVHGFDASPDMLAACRTNLDRADLHADLIEARFETCPTDRMVGAVIIPAGSFQLMTDEATVRQALTRFRSILDAGGLFMFDIDPPGLIRQAALARPTTRSWTLGPDARLTLTETPEDLDPVGHIATFRHDYCHAIGKTIADTDRERFALRWWEIRELEDCLTASGFRILRIVADYSPDEPLPAAREALTIQAIAD